MTPIVSMRQRHGEPSTYRQGCRCDDCREAESNYQRQRRKAREAEAAAATTTKEAQ